MYVSYSLLVIKVDAETRSAAAAMDGRPIYTLDSIKQLATVVVVGRRNGDIAAGYRVARGRGGQIVQAPHRLGRR